MAPLKTSLESCHRVDLMEDVGLPLVLLSPACSSTSISLWSLWGQCEASAARMNRMKLHLTTKFLREIDSWGFGWRQSTLAANKYFHVQSPKGFMLLPPNQTPFSRFVCAIVSERKYRVLVRKPNHNHQIGRASGRERV